jgi:hypothetical protein
MPRYQSVDELQNYLATEVFHYTESGKKAAGRALGTLVEIITFYLLHSWGLRDSMLIEKSLPEYANTEISHNVEYTLHPVLQRQELDMPATMLPLSASRVRRAFFGPDRVKGPRDISTQILSKSHILRNCCVIERSNEVTVVANLKEFNQTQARILIAKLHNSPYAMFECKRVGVEEGMKKGPQTIEKAKQGAYVAKSVSNLQKIRLTDGSQGAVLVMPGVTAARIDRYETLLEEVLSSRDIKILGNFILTVGVVSNHGNWFTRDNMNKETKILSQAYDWLLFLSDAGLSQFIRELIIEPEKRFIAVSQSFKKSYTGMGNGTRFTKTLMDATSHECLMEYFSENQEKIYTWFNVLAPTKRSLDDLKEELIKLKSKPWTEMLA